ncbi:30S ribosomal protein S11 [Candidatus Roizmanbacteria bacterium]|nr:30S ribosomal protein S11 [Candidatus Roizmanbacteria bacterium]
MKDTKKTEQPGKSVKKGRIYITSTFNNTTVTVTDQEGNVICWSSSGNAGFAGARRATPYAATKTVTTVLSKMKDLDTRELEVYLKGAGSGREAALRALKNSGMKLSLIADVTPIPHNGIRPKKKRRV